MKSLDLVTTEAVIELRTAIRRHREIQHTDVRVLSPVKRALHHGNVDRAAKRVTEAWRRLQLVLSDDE